MTEIKLERGMDIRDRKGQVWHVMTVTNGEAELFTGRGSERLVYKWGRCPEMMLGVEEVGTVECTVKCYGETETWASRETAMAFYAVAEMECEGCEAERYSNVYFDLLMGKDYATDGQDW